MLTGHFLHDAAPIDLDLPDLHLPRVLPISLPSSLVELRPDIKGARDGDVLGERRDWCRNRECAPIVDVGWCVRQRIRQLYRPVREHQ